MARGPSCLEVEIIRKATSETLHQRRAGMCFR